MLIALPTSLTDKNLYAYCDNNPVMRKDAGGAFWETALDIVSVVVSITDVVANPTNAAAWLSLGADVACTLLPGLTGGGAIVRAVTKADDAIDAAKAVYKAADKASDIRKATGSYEIVYKSGQTYVGKGGFKRAISSAKRYANKSEVASITWKKAANRTEAFIDEYKSMCKYGGIKNNKNSLNKIWSPGRKYYYKKYGSYYTYGGKTW